MQCICKNGHVFMWIRKGEKTKPEYCPECECKELDVREV